MASQESELGYLVLVYSPAPERLEWLENALQGLGAVVCRTRAELSGRLGGHSPTIVVVDATQGQAEPVKELPPSVSVILIGPAAGVTDRVDLSLPASVSPQELRRSVELAARLAEARSMLDDYQQRLAEAGARQSALATEIDKQRTALEQLATTDPLTGLYNRRYLEQWLASQFRVAKRYATPVSVVLLDVDHFKRVNDTYSHAFGDQVLREIAALLRGMLRESDVVARLGGDEFAVVAAQIDEVSAARLAARTLERAATHRFTHSSGELCVTVSAGVSEYPAGGAAGPEELLHQADVAMYAAKDAGRNRICVFSQVPATK